MHTLCLAVDDQPVLGTPDTPCCVAVCALGWCGVCRSFCESECILLGLCWCVCRRASQMALVVKNPPISAGEVGDLGSIPGLERPPGGGQGNPSSVLAWRLHGQRSLVAYGPRGHQASDTTEATCTRVHVERVCCGRSVCLAQLCEPGTVRLSGLEGFLPLPVLRCCPGLTARPLPLRAHPTPFHRLCPSQNGLSISLISQNGRRLLPSQG